SARRVTTPNAPSRARRPPSAPKPGPKPLRTRKPPPTLPPRLPRKPPKHRPPSKTAETSPKRSLMRRIGAAPGIRGEVWITSFTAEPLALKQYVPLATDRPGLTIEIESARATTNVLVARIKGVTDRTAAEKLNGVELYVDRDKLPATDEDDFYQADL